MTTMFKLLSSPANRRVFYKYIALTLLIFTLALSFQFSVILKAFDPRFVVLPLLLAVGIGTILAWNAILRRDLEKSNQAKSDLISGVSHELRTPLTVINGFSRILSQEQELKPRHRDFAQKIYDNGEHLLQIINDLLDLSQINSGRLQVHLQAVNVHQELQAVEALMAGMAANKQIRLYSTAVDEQLAVYADQTRFHQVLINLLSNAIKYSPEASEVQVRTTCQHQRVKLEVIDQGPGISADKLPELFTPFNRLGADQSKVKGTGIGLAISKNLIEMMQGEIGVHCESGRGCCFWLTLPQA